MDQLCRKYKLDKGFIKVWECAGAMYYPIITKRPSQKHLSISYKWVAEVNYEVYEATTTIVSYISSPCL